MRPVAPTDSAPQRVGDRYSLGEQIGSGGMATVYLGRRLSGDRRPVAVKRMHSWLAKDPDLVAALLDEGRVVACIAHRSVVALHEVIAQDKDVLLVLEYVHGETLSSVLRTLRHRQERVPVAVACALARDLLSGLHAAHEATDPAGRPLGIVHRDVSPQNVIVGVDGLAHLLDFGVAKAVGRSQSTRNGAIKGKLAYMAPEQLRGGLVTRRTDVYAAGVVLWEMLTGGRLFDSRKDVGVALSQAKEPIAPPSSMVPDLPASLDAIALRALAREPRDRYPNAAEMAADIERSVAPAAEPEVSRWVRSVASESLARRSSLLSGTDDADTRTRIHAAPGRAVRPGPGRVLTRYAVLFGVGALVLAAATWLHFWRW
jgi:serine/threonine protein kinase